MIRAVCFDWFNTLARYEPSREELELQVLTEFGLSASLPELKRGFLIADRELFEANTLSPLRQKSPEEQAKTFLQHAKKVLNEARVTLPDEEETLPKIMKRMQEMSGQMKFVLFGDVLLTLKTLKAKKLKVGLLTNLDKDMTALTNELGLHHYIDFVVTAAEAGADKPAAPMFLMALQKAGVKGYEAVHVGDQYTLDCIGARGVGMVPVLIDRDGLNADVTDCRRIKSLTEIVDLLPIL